MWLCLYETDSLSVKTGSAVLQANSVWGALRGLETFSQIIYHCPIAGMVHVFRIRFLPLCHQCIDEILFVIIKKFS